MKITLKYLFLCFTFFSFTASTLGADVKIGELYYDLYSDGSAEVVYEEDKPYKFTELIIPSKINYKGRVYKVTSIDSFAFDECSSLESVTIPNSITKIGKYAFYDCSSLESITIPSSVSKIEENTFAKCSSLENVTIPNTVTIIGNYAFEYCSSLESNTIPNSVTTIGRGAFYDCSSLERVEILNSFTKIDEYAFDGCDSLKIVYLPENKFDELKRYFPSYYDIQFKRLFITLNDLKKGLLSWDEFYNKKSIPKLTSKNMDHLQNQINEEFDKWQKKDEFETTEEWKERVNDDTREPKFQEIKESVINKHNVEIQAIKNEQSKLGMEYEKYKEDLLNEYYVYKIYKAIDSFFINEDFDLQPYDADHQTFLISSSKFGDILLEIPRDEARSFKENWDDIELDPEFVPNGEGVSLSKIRFFNGDKEYVYDLHKKANYVDLGKEYTIKPVEIPVIQ